MDLDRAHTSGLSRPCGRAAASAERLGETGTCPSTRRKPPADAGLAHLLLKFKTNRRSRIGEGVNANGCHDNHALRGRSALVVIKCGLDVSGSRGPGGLNQLPSPMSRRRGRRCARVCSMSHRQSLPVVGTHISNIREMEEGEIRRAVYRAFTCGHVLERDETPAENNPVVLIDI
jgi:hypothetical protein